MKLNGLQTLRKPDSALPSLPYQIFTYSEGSNCRFEEAQSYVLYCQCHKKVNKAIHLLSQQVGELLSKKQLGQKAENREF